MIIESRHAKYINQANKPRDDCEANNAEPTALQIIGAVGTCFPNPESRPEARDRWGSADIVVLREHFYQIDILFYCQLLVLFFLKVYIFSTTNSMNIRILYV